MALFCSTTTGTASPMILSYTRQNNFSKTWKTALQQDSLSWLITAILVPWLTELPAECADILINLRIWWLLLLALGMNTRGGVSLLRRLWDTIKKERERNAWQMFSRLVLPFHVHLCISQASFWSIGAGVCFLNTPRAREDDTLRTCPLQCHDLPFKTTGLDQEREYQLFSQSKKIWVDL